MIATSNCPWDLDAAILRRLEKRIYIPLPDKEQRKSQFRYYLRQLFTKPGALPASYHIADDEDLLEFLAGQTANMSGADIHIICREAAMIQVRKALYQKSEHHVNDIFQTSTQVSEKTSLLSQVRDMIVSDNISLNGN